MFTNNLGCVVCAIIHTRFIEIDIAEIFNLSKIFRMFISCMYFVYISVCRGGFSSFVYLVINRIL